jgi:hypothetical protein
MARFLRGFKARAQDYSCQSRLPQLLSSLDEGHPSGKRQARIKRSPQEEVSTSPISTTGKALEDLILWVSSQRAEL